MNQLQVDIPDERRSLLPSRRSPSLVHTRNGRLLVLTLATVTMVVEMCSLVTQTTIQVGDIGVSASTVPALLLLVFLGVPTVGRAGDRDRLVPFWIAMIAGMGMGAALFAREGDLSDLGALLLAATDEEVVYRFAVPVVAATGLMVLRVPGRVARVTGYVVAGVWWVLLPGHQEQTASIGTLLTYAAFAVIAAVVVARSRALIPMSVAHCVLNVITVLAFRGEISEGSRAALSACLLFLLIGTFAWPGDRPAGAPAPARRHDDRDDRDDDHDLVGDTVIDLRDGQRPSIIREGTVEYLEDEVVDLTDDPAEVDSGRR